MQDKKVVILGGGIGGLTLCAALQHFGLTSTVYEKATSWRHGAGIWVPPNAMQVLDRLGIAAQLKGKGNELDRLELSDAKYGKINSIELSSAKERFGFTTLAIHRGHLHEELLIAAGAGNVHTGKRLTEISANGNSSTLHFEDGEAVITDVIVGADGIHSSVREEVAPGAHLRYSGQSSYRAVVPFALASGLNAVSREIWSDGCRFGFSGIGNGLVYWYATFDATPGVTADPEASWRHACHLAGKFPDPVPAIIQATVPDDILRTDIEDMPPGNPWFTGSIVLLGDAAHAATPNLGQGGAQAMEDAFVLAQEMSRNSDAPSAFNRYMAIRKSKADQITEQAYRFGKMAHVSIRPLRFLRNVVFKATPARMQAKQVEALYTLNF